jgi:hypothetical protein
VRAYAAAELNGVMARLQRCGFSRSDVREALMQFLHEDEWTSAERGPSTVGAIPDAAAF